MIAPNIIRQDEVNVIFVRSELDDARLTAYEFRVYAHIARRSNCFASLESMADICQMSESQIKRVMASLKEKGMIHIISRPGTTNLISITPPRIWSEDTWRQIELSRRAFVEGIEGSQEGEGSSVGATHPALPELPPSSTRATKDIPLRKSPLREGEEQPSDSADGEPRETVSPQGKPPVSHPKSSAPPPPTPRQRNLLGETMLEVCWGIADYTKATAAQWSLASKTLKELKQVQPDLTPEMLREFAARMRREWDGRSFTPAAIAKHWRPIPASGNGIPDPHPFPGSARVTTAELVARFPSGPEQAKWRRRLMEEGRY
jgi:hypothetical protein